MIKANRKVMKKILVMFIMMMVAMVTFAKDIKTVVFTTSKFNAILAVVQQ